MTISPIRRSVALGAVALALGAGLTTLSVSAASAAPAAAVSQSSVGSAFAITSSTTLVAGKPSTISGTSAAGANILVIMPGNQFAEADADASGHWSTSVTLGTGQYGIDFLVTSGLSSERTGLVWFAVKAPITEAGNRQLSR